MLAVAMGPLKVSNYLAGETVVEKVGKSDESLAPREAVGLAAEMVRDLVAMMDDGWAV